MLSLGAQGVQMGTRFAATVESDASEAFKQAYVQSAEEDVVIIDSPVGLPGRALRNRFTDEASARPEDPLCLPLPLPHTVRPEDRSLLHCRRPHQHATGESRQRVRLRRPRTRGGWIALSRCRNSWTCWWRNSNDVSPSVHVPP